MAPKLPPKCSQNAPKLHQNDPKWHPGPPSGPLLVNVVLISSFLMPFGSQFGAQWAPLELLKSNIFDK